MPPAPPRAFGWPVWCLFETRPLGNEHCRCAGLPKWGPVAARRAMPGRAWSRLTAKEQSRTLRRLLPLCARPPLQGEVLRPPWGRTAEQWLLARCTATEALLCALGVSWPWEGEGPFLLRIGDWGGCGRAAGGGVSSQEHFKGAASASPICY